MVSLWTLTGNLEVGDKLAWVAEQSMGEANEVYPKTVTHIEMQEDTVIVEADGIRGGKYSYQVSRSGDSEAFFLNPNKEHPEPRGSIAFAGLTDSTEPVRVKEGHYDRRGR